MRLTPLIIKLHILQTLKLTLRNQRVPLRSHVLVGGPGVEGEDVGGSVLLSINYQLLITVGVGEKGLERLEMKMDGGDERGEGRRRGTFFAVWLSVLYSPRSICWFSFEGILNIVTRMVFAAILSDSILIPLKMRF